MKTLLSQQMTLDENLKVLESNILEETVHLERDKFGIRRIRQELP